MGELIPIVRGALYRDVSTSNSHTDTLRVRSVWVDEDSNTQVTIYRNLDDEYRVTQKETIDIDSFIHQIDRNIIRINTDTEAWKWRDEHNTE
jgi:hypothetical protein